MKWQAGVRTAALAMLLVAWTNTTPAQAPEGRDDSAQTATVILVAAPNLTDAPYRRSVIIVTPTEGDRHIGIIINRPTRRSLSSLFPDHAPSRAVVEPVYFGGPMASGALFAIAHGDRGLKGSVPLMKDLTLALAATAVDSIIESTPNEARYYVGSVQWQPGELRQELRRGLWDVLEADPSLVFSADPEHLWSQLSNQARGTMALAAWGASD